jgi:hypothetical protein
MNVHDAPTQIVRAFVPARPRSSSRLHRIAVCAVMLMLFELGFALGGYRARRPPKHPAIPKVTVVARPAPIEIEPILLTPDSVVRSEGAGLRSENSVGDSAVR